MLLVWKHAMIGLVFPPEFRGRPIPEGSARYFMSKRSDYEAIVPSFGHARAGDRRRAGADAPRRPRCHRHGGGDLRGEPQLRQSLRPFSRRQRLAERHPGKTPPTLPPRPPALAAAA